MRAGSVAPKMLEVGSSSPVAGWVGGVTGLAVGGGARGVEGARGERRPEDARSRFFLARDELVDGVNEFGRGQCRVDAVERAGLHDAEVRVARIEQLESPQTAAIVVVALAADEVAEAAGEVDRQE